MYIHLVYVVFVLFFSPNDLIYNLLFCVNDLWFTMCISKILSQEQHLYHVILNKSVYSGNMLQVFIITEAIVLLIWKVFWTCLFPPMLWNLNRAVATGISPVSIVERVHSYSTKRINLRDVKHSWYFRHLKMDNFKLLHTSRIVHSWNCWHLYPCCSFSKNEAGWWLTYALVWNPWWPKAPSVSYQPASPFDTGSEEFLLSHSNNCMFLLLRASSQPEHRPCICQKREYGDLALSLCQRVCWPEFSFAVHLSVHFFGCYLDSA